MCVCVCDLLCTNKGINKVHEVPKLKYLNYSEYHFHGSSVDLMMLLVMLYYRCMFSGVCKFSLYNPAIDPF